jgi:undecaprenyl-diphosphatase
LPISSSAHTALLPRLAGWPYADLDPDLRKAFEATLHAGSAAGIAATARPALGWRRHALLLVPVVVAGYALERPIERRLGSLRSIAIAQIAAGLALLAADSRPARKHALTTADAAAIGVAQAVALIPGVSRSGAVVTAARAFGYDAAAAAAVSTESAAPVLAGAGALKAWRLARNPPPSGARAAVVAGALASLLSTIAAGRVMPRARGYRGFAAYRIAFGAVALRKGRRR